MALIHAIPDIVFQSTPSAWRETTVGRFCRRCKCISIHSLRMEGDDMFQSRHDVPEISIHSLRMEGDGEMMEVQKMKIISIHSLRMEGDYRYYEEQTAELEFQSTPSAWRETPYPG